MLESYFQPKIKREHEENKNVQPRAKKKETSFFLKKKERERIRTRFQKISEEAPKYFNYKPVYCNFFDTVFTNTFSYRCLK